jgi:hypothetical protein
MRHGQATIQQNDDRLCWSSRGAEVRGFEPLTSSVRDLYRADRGRGGPSTRRRRAVAVDGKTLRGARGASADGRPVHLPAAMDHTTRQVLAQRQVAGAPDEVPAFQPLLYGSTLTGWWSPRMRCKPTPRPPSSWSPTKHANYLLAVKANQPRLLARCASLP